MSFDEMKLLLDQIKQLQPTERGPFQAALVTGAIVTVAKDIVVGLVVFFLGRRMVQATLSVIREAKRGPDEQL